MIASGDLSATNWLLTAPLVGIRDATAAGDEQVRFVISARQVDFVAVPVPGAWALVAVSGALSSDRRRRLASAAC